MKNWKEEFELVEVRKKSAADAEFWANTARYVFLTPEIAMPGERYAALAPWDQVTALAAAVGLTADTAVVSGKSAARLWGMEMLGWDPQVELLYLNGRHPGSRRSWRPGVRFRYCLLSRDEIHAEHGIRVTDVLRTLRDVTRFHGLIDGVAVIDSARKKWPGLSVAVLHEGMTSGAPYKGIGLVRKAIDMSITNSGSPLESKARVLLMEANLPEVKSIRAQARFFYNGNRSYFDVDLLINEWLIIEIDGEVKYDGRTFGRKTEDVIKDERQREKILQNAGNVVIRVGHEDLVQRADGRCGLIDLVESAFRIYPEFRIA